MTDEIRKTKPEARMKNDDEEKSEEEQILTCPKCMKFLNNPVTLGCMHVFCSPCAEQMKSQVDDDEASGFSVVECLICRSISRDIEIEKSTLMAALRQEYEKLQRPLQGERRTCDQCETDDSYWKCTQCKIYLCEKCFDAHQRIPYCKGHRSFASGTDTALVIDQVVFCAIHDNMRIEYNCADCETPMCETCRITEHESHRCETVQEALERLIPIHVKHCEDLDSELFEIQSDVDGIEKRIAASDDDTSKQELKRIRNNVYLLMTKYHTLRWWITLAMDRSRDEFLLRELQGHVKQRLRENGRVEMSSNNTQFTPRLVTNRNPDIKRPDDKKPKRQVAPVRREVVTRCGYDSFNELLNHKQNLWLMETQVHVSGDGCSKIGIINGSIWIPVRDMDCIKILQPDNGYLESIIELPVNTRPWVIQQINHSTIIMASETGIYRLNDDGSIKDRLHDGTFNDVNADGNYRFVCLEYTNNKALLFQCSGLEEQWKLEKTIQLRTGSKHHLFSSVMMLHDSVTASGNTVNADSGVIHKYNPSSGKRRTHEKTHANLRRPILCGIDSKGFILIADSWLDKVLVLSPEGNIKAVKLNHQVNIRGPKDIVFLDDEIMWVLAEEAMGSTLMLKYTRTTIQDKDSDDDSLEDVGVLTGSEEQDE